MSATLLEKANLISVAEAARLCKVTPGRIRQVIDAGLIEAEHLTDYMLVVNRDSAEAYARRPRAKPGPKSAS